MRSTLSAIWSPFPSICFFTHSISSIVVEILSPAPDLDPPTAATVVVVGVTRQLHGAGGGGEEKRKKRSTAEKAAPVRTSTGRDITTPFDDDDSRAMRVSGEISLPYCILL